MLLPASASAQVTVPQSWAGIWEVDLTSEPCGGGASEMSSRTDTLCSGTLIWEDFIEGVDEVEVEIACSGQVTDNMVDLTCTWTATSEGFTITSTFTSEITRSGDSFAGMETQSIEYSGDGCEFVPGGCETLNTCTESEISGIRTASEPPECQTPVVSISWGQIKALYN